MITGLGMHPGYALLSNGQCCDDKIYADLGQAAELAAWWQRNKAAGGEVITVGAISPLVIPVDMLRQMQTPSGACSPQTWPTKGGWLTFSVADDGHGYDSSTTAIGSGIQNMADRLSALGGSMNVRSVPGGGTTVTGRIPVAVEQSVPASSPQAT